MQNNTHVPVRKGVVPPLCVFPDKYARGWDGPGGIDVSTWGIAEGLRVLSHRYSSDAHVCLYLAEGPWSAGQQPRLRVGAAGSVDVIVPWFFVDIDNPGHDGWPDEDTARRVCAGWKKEFPTAGVYSTRGGGRLVFWLEPAWSVASFGGRARALLASVASRLGLEVSRKGAPAPKGLHVDGHGDEWTRLYRLPLVRRDGVEVVPAFMDLSGMAGLEWTRTLGRRTPVVDVRPVDARRGTWGKLEALGGVLAGTVVRKLPCPACGSAAVWWDMTRVMARCNHKQTCGWTGEISEVVK